MSEGQNIFPARKLDMNLSEREKAVIEVGRDIAKENKVEFDYMTAVIVIRIINDANPLRKEEGVII